MDRSTRMNESLMLLNSFLAPESPGMKHGGILSSTMLNRTLAGPSKFSDTTFFLNSPAATSRTHLECTITDTNASTMQQSSDYEASSDSNSIYLRLNKKCADILFSDDFQSHPLDKITQIVAALELELNQKKKHNRLPTDEIFGLLRNEQHTWKLMLALMSDRMQDMPEAPDIDTIIRSGYSEKVIAEQLLSRDRSVRELQIVIDWLESCARDRPGKFTPHSFYYFENSILKHDSSKQEACYHPDILSSDPDMLHPQDKDNLGAFFKYVFWLVRSGNLAAVRNVAFKFGHGWLVSCLEGRRLYHDPNYERNSDPSEQMAVEGNKSRKLWKRVCRALAQDTSLNKYQRALYGRFCGELPAVLNVCQSWEDRLWAYSTCLLDDLVDQEVALYIPDRSTDNDSVVKSLDDIFNKLEAECAIANQLTSYLFQVQKFLILDQHENLTSSILRTEVAKNSQLSRFSCSVGILLRELQLLESDADFDALVQKYVNDLIHFGNHSLVCLFMPHLQDPIAFYCRFLTTNVPVGSREDYIRLASDRGLDSATIRATLISCSKQSYKPQQISDEITDEEIELLQSLSLLKSDLHIPSQFLYTANSILRVFLSARRLLPLWDALAKIPPSIIEEIVKPFRRSDNSAVIPDREANIIKEFICLKSCINAYSDLRDNSSKRILPEKTLIQVFEVLRFAGGWLVDEKDVTEYFGEEEERGRQMELLRRMMIPELVFQLLTLIKATEKYQLASDVLNFVMDKRFGMYDLFDSAQLELLDNLCLDCTAPLLDSHQAIV